MLIKYPSPNLGLIIKHRCIQLKKAFLRTQKTIGNSQTNKDRLGKLTARKAGLLLRQQHGRSEAPVPDFLFATGVKVEGLGGGPGTSTVLLHHPNGVEKSLFFLTLMNKGALNAPSQVSALLPFHNHLGRSLTTRRAGHGLGIHLAGATPP